MRELARGLWVSEAPGCTWGVVASRGARLVVDPAAGGFDALAVLAADHGPFDTVVLTSPDRSPLPPGVPPEALVLYPTPCRRVPDHGPSVGFGGDALLRLGEHPFELVRLEEGAVAVHCPLLHTVFAGALASVPARERRGAIEKLRSLRPRWLIPAGGEALPAGEPGSWERLADELPGAPRLAVIRSDREPAARAAG